MCKRLALVGVQRTNAGGRTSGGGPLVKRGLFVFLFQKKKLDLKRWRHASSGCSARGGLKKRAGTCTVQAGAHRAAVCKMEGGGGGPCVGECAVRKHVRATASVHVQVFANS